MKRFTILVTGYCALAALLAPVLVRPVPRLVWNASASVPVGLYAAQPVKQLGRGDLVAVHAPGRLAALMAERHYLPRGVPMLKHVGALPGQTICRSGRAISIDGSHAADALARDSMGRSLPVWSGCHTLRPGEIFLLNPASQQSFDGRYFGPLAAASAFAQLRPLWLPGGHYAAPWPRISSAQLKTKGALS